MTSIINSTGNDGGTAIPPRQTEAYRRELKPKPKAVSELSAVALAKRIAYGAREIITFATFPRTEKIQPLSRKWREKQDISKNPTCLSQPQVNGYVTAYKEAIKAMRRGKSKAQIIHYNTGQSGLLLSPKTDGAYTEFQTRVTQMLTPELCRQFLGQYQDGVKALLSELASTKVVADTRKHRITAISILLDDAPETGVALFDQLPQKTKAWLLDQLYTAKAEPATIAPRLTKRLIGNMARKRYPGNRPARSITLELPAELRQLAPGQKLKNESQTENTPEWWQLGDAAPHDLHLGPNDEKPGDAGVLV